jgi:lipopolysaccharide transport system ATP-binding protein
MPAVISVENLSKSYRLGQIGTGTFSHDLNVWWARVRGKPNPMLRIGESDNGNRQGETIWALKDVSFTVDQGEVLGIIGRNGAGKSTLLKILSRVTAPTSGKVKVRGRIASLLEVGTGFHPDMTGRENIYLNGAILGMTRGEITRKFDEIVDFAEVEKFIDTPVKRYSSGMSVRLAFAVAAHLDPEILLVDEVLAVGDAAFQKKCLGKMGDVAKEGRTILFVSHNMGAVARLCSFGAVLKSGKIEYRGRTSDAVEYYSSTPGERSSWMSGEIMNTHPFNILSVRVLDHKGLECDRFPIGSRVIIELCTRVSKSINSSHVHVMLIYAGTVLFRAFDTDEFPDLLVKRPVGNYTHLLTLDTTFLKPGPYQATVDLGIRPSVILEQIVDVVSFELFDPEGDFDRGWSESRQGLIRAPVAWKISAVKEGVRL